MVNKEMQKSLENLSGVANDYKYQVLDHLRMDLSPDNGHLKLMIFLWIMLNLGLEWLCNTSIMLKTQA